MYEYCEGERVTHFIRLPANTALNRLIEPYLISPVERPPKRAGGFRWRWMTFVTRPRRGTGGVRVVAKIDWHYSALFPRIGFVVTNSQLPAGKVAKAYNGRTDGENRMSQRSGL